MASTKLTSSISASAHSSGSAGGTTTATGNVIFDYTTSETNTGVRISGSFKTVLSRSGTGNVKLFSDELTIGFKNPSGTIVFANKAVDSGYSYTPTTETLTTNLVITLPKAHNKQTWTFVVRDKNQGTSYTTELEVEANQSSASPGGVTSRNSVSLIGQGGDKYTGDYSISVPALASYTVTYNANGGSSTPSTQTKWYGEPLTPASAISRTGYTFYKWKASDGTLYTAGASNAYTANSGTTMTAQWNANTYTVVYNGNGNTGGSTASSSHTYDVQKALTANGFTKTDYLFKGWATTQDGPVVYSNGQSVANLTATHGGTVNLYAVWEKAYVEPNILNLSVERVRPTTVNNDTVYVLDDEGKIGKVFITANPGKKKSVPGDQNPQPIPTRLQIYYKRSVSDASEQNLLELITYDTINTDGASSTQYIDATSTGKTGFEIGTDEQCEILVIAQGIDDNAVKCTALRSTVLMVAKYIVDFNQNPQYDSVGFFGVAPDINDVVYVKGDILIEVDPNSGTDELYNAIHALGWDNDVLIN